MKMNIIAILALLIISHAFSQRKLTLSQCLTLAHENSLQLRNARDALQSFVYLQREQASAAHPQIKAVSTVNYAPHSNRWGYDPISTDGGLVNAQLSIQQPLSSRRVNRLHAKISDLDKQVLESQLVKAERDLTLSIKQQFVETLRGQSEIKLHRESVARLSEYLSAVQLQYAGGTGEYVDVIKTKTQLSKEQETLLKTQMTVALSKLSLGLLIGTAEDTSIELCGDIDTMVSVVRYSDFHIDTVKNPDIITVQYEIDAGILEFDLIKRGKYPVITPIIDAGYLSSFDRLNSSESKTTFGFSGGATLEIPLVDWGVLHNQKLRQQQVIDTLRTAKKIQMQLLQSEYRTLQIKMSNALSLIESIKSRIKDAREDYLLTKSKHASGASSSADLLLAQQTFTDAIMDELQTKANILTLANNLEQLSDFQRK